MRLEHLLSGRRAPAGAAGPRIAIPSRAAARGAGESRSSAGQSATLIMWRPPVQIRAGLRPGGAGGLAQLVERLLCKQGAAGSSPAFSTGRGGGIVHWHGAPGAPAPPRGRRRQAEDARSGMELEAGAGTRAAARAGGTPGAARARPAAAPGRAGPRGASAREAKAGRTADAQAPGGDEGRA